MRPRSYRLFVLLQNIFFQFPANFEEKWLIGKLRSRQEHLLLRAYIHVAWLESVANCNVSLVSPISKGDFIWVLINKNPKKNGPTQNTQKDFKRADSCREQILIRST